MKRFIFNCISWIKQKWQKYGGIDRCQKGLFWGWNGIFILFTYFGLLPTLGPSLALGWMQSEINVDMFLFFMVLLFMAPAASYIAYKKFTNDPKTLIRILYGVEVPLFLLVFFRIVFLRDLNPGIAHLLTVITLGSATFLFTLLSSNWARTKLQAGCVLAGTSLFLWCGLWVSGFLMFFVPPSAWALLVGIKNMIVEFFSIPFAELFHLFLKSIKEIFLSLPMFFSMLFLVMAGWIFLSFTATLFVGLPFVYIHLAWDAFRKTFRGFCQLGTRRLAWSIAALVLVGNTSLFLAFNQQNHAEVLERLSAHDGSAESRHALLKDADDLKQSLVAIYLAPYRYFGDAKRTRVVQSLYKDVFGLSYKKTEPLQTAFKWLASPLIYRGSEKGMKQDQKEAARLYEWFFDHSIQEDERDAIRSALKSTYSWEPIEAGLINIDEKKVYLEEQTVTLKDHGAFAEIHIHEVYFNTETRPQEVFYHFSLPENAVITGLWLGPTENKRHAFQVAPRGAAQKVYKRIQQQRQDPALLEQVGPGLYRMRVFPVPANRAEQVAHGKKNKMHLWWTYKVMRNGEAAWPLPKLTEKRNVYWDKKSRRTIDGKHSESDRWFPTYLLFQSEPSPQILKASVDDGVEMWATPKHAAARDDSKPARIALILETSFSMKAQQKRLNTLKAWFDLQTDKTHIQWDFYRIDHRDEAVSSLDDLFSPDTEYFASVDAADALQRFHKLKAGQSYDGVILLTDRSSFKEVKREQALPSGTGPLWFWLADGARPRVTGDGFMRAILASGGGLENDFSTIVKNIRLRSQLNEDLIAQDPYYEWTLHRNLTEPSETHPGFQALAAKKYINYLMTKNAADDPEQAILKYHELAWKHGLVTPYSSMIVLVSQAQKDMLKEAEKSSDRFKRDMETGEKILNAPHQPLEASAVPEPEEWALIFLGLLIAIQQYLKTRPRPVKLWMVH